MKKIREKIKYDFEWDEQLESWKETLVCERCRERLAVWYSDSGELRFISFLKNCDHFIWHSFGEFCYNNLPCTKCPLGFNTIMCNSIFENRLWVLYDGRYHILNRRRG